MPLWPLSKVLHLWGLFPNLLYYVPSQENTPLQAGKSPNQTWVTSDQNTLFFHKNLFCYPMSSHGFSLHFTICQHLGYSILVHNFHIVSRNIKSKHFPIMSTNPSFYIYFKIYVNFLNMSMSCWFSILFPFP